MTYQKILRSLDINKAHGHDDISVRMVKICDDTIQKPLSIIYNNYITTGIYSNAWKKSNIVPVHKKGDKQMLTITDQSYFFLFLVKFLRKSYLIPFLDCFETFFKTDCNKYC